MYELTKLLAAVMPTAVQEQKHKHQKHRTMNPPALHQILLPAKASRTGRGSPAAFCYSTNYCHARLDHK